MLTGTEDLKYHSHIDLLTCGVLVGAGDVPEYKFGYLGRPVPLRPAPHPLRPLITPAAIFKQSVYRDLFLASRDDVLVVAKHIEQYSGAIPHCKRGRFSHRNHDRVSELFITPYRPSAMFEQIGTPRGPSSWTLGQAAGENRHGRSKRCMQKT